MGKIRLKQTKSTPTIVKNEEEQDDEMMENQSVEEHNDPEFDKRSVISSKTIKSLVSKKKDKIKLKREFLLKRLHAAHESKREAKERAARRQTVIVSDMKHEFENSLGQIESYLEEQRLVMATKKSSKRQIPTQSERIRQNQNNVEIFSKIADSSEYCSNPFEMIKKQLQQQIQSVNKKSKK